MELADSESSGKSASGSSGYKLSSHSGSESAPKGRTKKKQILTPRLLGALDKYKVTNRDAVHVISAVLIAAGLNIKDFTFSYSTLLKYRKENRKKIAEEMQKNYHVID